MSPDQPDDNRDVQSDSDAERIPDARPRATPLWALISGWLLSVEAWLRSHGGDRLRTGVRVFWALIAVGGLVLLVGPVINKPLTLEGITSSASDATGRWIAREFAVDYTITRAADGTLHAQVEERITAFFPDEVDEQGIERVLATEYQGHSLAPSVISATLDGTPIEVKPSSTPTLLTLAMDSGERLQGDHLFVLRYELENLAYETTDLASRGAVQLLEWDVFGPSWPQGLAGLEVRVTLPREVDERLIRQPRGSLAWLIIGGGQWLEPEADSPAGAVSYAFSSDQNVPPHANAWFTMTFEPGTFVMPAPTPLFWVQTFGPLAPLAFLLATLLLALAARAVAWSDARGRPWFVAQNEPPRGITPRTAAQLLETPRSLELAEALQIAQQKRGKTAVRDAWMAAAQAAQRSGRLGDLPRALVGYLTAPERRAQLAQGLRRVPRGFVRDLFIAAPLALTLVQWGLVRQLSYQAKLSVVWWPVAFVIVSTLMAAVVLGIALSSRPLTREGALAKQHLRGIGVYAERTLLFERGPLSDPALPYAVLLAPPRKAGRQISALVESSLGEPGASRGWRTPGFLTWPRLSIHALSLLVVGGIFAMTLVAPNPYDPWHDYASYGGSIPGTSYTKVDAIDAAAVLSRDTQGRARLKVTELLTVSFEEDAPQVPQFAQQWPNTVDGQDLDLRVDSVRIDGADAPFETEQDVDTLLMRTALVEALSGSHEVEIVYTVASAAFAAEAPRASGGGIVDRVRWAALLEGWEHDYSWGDDSPVDPLRLELRLSDELASEAARAGWITLDTDSAERPRDWEDSVVPFGAVASLPDSGATTESSVRTNNEIIKVLELRHDENDSYPWVLRVDDVGAMLDFPAGTFVGPDAAALRATQFVGVLPVLLSIILGALALALGSAGVAIALRRETRLASGFFYDLLRWLAPAAGLGAIIIFVWISVSVPADEPALAPTGIAALSGIAGGVAGAIVGWRKAR